MPNYHRGLIPGKPTRFPGGLNTNYPTDTLNNLPFIDPTLNIVDFDDFIVYTAADWVVTSIGAGTQALVAAGYGGQILITSAGASGDGSFFQRAGSPFLITSGKRAFFKCRFSVDDATNSNIQMGLIIKDTTPLDATDGIYFLKAAASTAIQGYVRKDATTGSTSIANMGTMVAATFTTWGWEYDGATNVLFYIDDVIVGRIAVASTNMPDIALDLSFGVQAGTAAARTMTVDYAFGAQER